MLASERDESKDKNSGQLYRVIERILLIGMLSSIALMIFGVVIGLVRGQPIPDHAELPLSAFRGLIHLNATSIISVGILVLMATPVAYVLAGLIEFIGGRNWKFIIMTSIVIIVLAISVLLGVEGR